MLGRKKIVIKSSFHNTETFVWAHEKHNGYWISAEQHRRAMRKLCVPGCCCTKRIDGYQIAPTSCWPSDGWDIEEV